MGMASPLIGITEKGIFDYGADAPSRAEDCKAEVGALLTLQSPISMPAEILEVLHLLFRQLPPEARKAGLMAWGGWFFLREPVLKGNLCHFSPARTPCHQSTALNPVDPSGCGGDQGVLRATGVLRAQRVAATPCASPRGWGGIQ